MATMATMAAAVGGTMYLCREWIGSKVKAAAAVCGIALGVVVIAVLLRKLSSSGCPDPVGMDAPGVQRWFEVHKDGMWLEHAAAFSKLDGQQVSAMMKEDFEKRAPESGDVIFNDWQQALRDCASLRRAAVETLQSWAVWAVIVVAWAAYVWWSTQFANDDRALRFWNSLPDQLPPVGTYFSVPELGGKTAAHIITQAIYVRHCYHDLARICEGLERSAIVGTPGIGKSLFLQFFIAYLKSAGVKRIVLARPIEHNVYTFDRTNGTVIAMCWSTAAYYASDYAKTFEIDDDAWYLFDATSSESDTPAVAGYNMVIGTSTKKRNSQQYTKELLGAGRAKLYMPCWDWPEVLAFCQACKFDATDVYMRSKFRKWGGVARFLFNDVSSNQDAEVEGAVSKCKNVEYLEQHIGDVDDLSNDSLHLILHLAVPDQVSYKDAISEWASEEVEELVMKKRDQDLDHARSSFVRETAGKSNMSGARGQSFEPLADARLMRGGEFKWKPLTQRPGSGGRRVNAVSKYVTRPAKKLKELFHVLTDIQAVQQDTYYLPDYRSFPAIDAASRNEVFQMTCGKTHPIDLPGCVAAVDKFSINSRREPFKFIFVVPDDLFDSWTSEQPFVETGGTFDGSHVPIEQYVMSIAL